MENTKIYKVLDERDALPDQKYWDELPDEIKNDYRDLQVMVNDNPDQIFIKEHDENLVAKFFEFFEEDAEELTKSEPEELAINEDELAKNEIEEPEEKIQTEEKLEVEENSTETENTQKEIPIVEPEQVINETDENMKDENTEQKIVEEQKEEQQLAENNETSTESGTEKEQETEEKKEPETETNTEEVGEINEESTQLENNQPQPYADFLAFAAEQPTVAASDMIKFGIPEEIWNNEKVSFEMGGLTFKKWALGLVFNRWEVIK